MREHPFRIRIVSSSRQCSLPPLLTYCIRIYRDMMLDSTVVCRRALGCEWGGLDEGEPSRRGLASRFADVPGDDGQQHAHA